MTSPLAIQGGVPVRRLPYPRWPDWTDAEQVALRTVMSSGAWGGFPYPGAEGARFAEAFARHLDVPHCILCSNGSIGLEYALKAIGLEPGDEVIVPAYTFAATATAVAFAHGVPVFVDVDPATYCLDPECVERAISPRTVAIVAVHLACNMTDMDRISRIASRHGLAVIEDCAQAHGHRWHDRAAGSLGDISVFSFEQSKLMTAGEGGAIVTRHGEYGQRAHSLVNCGRKLAGYDEFEGHLMGRNARMTEWQAAILSCQLPRLEEQTLARERGSELFQRLLADVPGITCTTRDPRNTRRAVYRFILKYDANAFDGLSRERFVEALNAEGLPAVAGFYPIACAPEVFPLDPSTNPMAALGLGRLPDSAALPVASRAAESDAIWIRSSVFLGAPDDIRDAANAVLKVCAHSSALRTCDGMGCSGS